MEKNNQIIKIMVNLQVVNEMMVQRAFQVCKSGDGYVVGRNKFGEYMYIKIFNGKLELNIVREFLSLKFTITSDGSILVKNTTKNVVQLIIICKSFQNLHVKEFKEMSKHIQLMKEDFLNINITKVAPKHEKVDRDMIRNVKELPIIKEDDPNCIFYNYVKGDVVRVTRKDGEVVYRLVR